METSIKPTPDDEALLGGQQRVLRVFETISFYKGEIE